MLHRPVQALPIYCGSATGRCCFICKAGQRVWRVPKRRRAPRERKEWYLFMDLLAQIAILLGVCLSGELLAAVLPFPFPSSVLAMLLMLLLLAVGVLKVRHVEGVTNFLMQNMAFFFVPLCVNILAYLEIIRANMIAILVICVVSTFLTFAATAFTVRGLMKLTRKRGGADHE